VGSRCRGENVGVGVDGLAAEVRDAAFSAGLAAVGTCRAASWTRTRALLDEGRLVACGAPEDVLTGPLLSRAYRHPIEVLAHPDPAAPPLVVPRRRSTRPTPTFQEVHT